MTTQSENRASEPVTAVVLRHVKPGRESEFEAWLHDLYTVAARFEGHQGTTVIRPRVPESHEYLIVFSFDAATNLEHWEESSEHSECLARLAPLIDELSPPIYQSGMETWFSIPGTPAKRPPPRWKMWILAASVLFLLLLVFNRLFGSTLASLPLAVRVLITAPVISAAMTWVVMPWMSKRFARWLYPTP